MTAADILIFAVLLGLIPATIAAKKGHSFLGFWLFGAALFIVALPVALLTDGNPKTQRQCPHCKAWIPKDASVCQKCSRDLPALAPAGWYPADDGIAKERFWDGGKWTTRYRNDD